MYIRRCSQRRAALAAAVAVGARTRVHGLSPLGHRDQRGKRRRLLRSALGNPGSPFAIDIDTGTPNPVPCPQTHAHGRSPALQPSAARGSLAAGPPLKAMLTGILAPVLGRRE